MTCVALSEDDAILAAADDDNCVSVMRLGEKSEVPELQRVLRGHDDCVTCIAVASRMNLVATASEDGSG